MFRSYWRIEDIEGYNYSHVMVNHELEFVDDDGNHTNNIEATWGALKRKISPRVRSKTVLQPYLFEQMWRDLHRGATWDAILYALRVIRYERGGPIPNHPNVAPFNPTNP